MWRIRNPWIPLDSGLFALGLEAGEVMALRSLTLMRGGPAAAAETQLMVVEKLAAMSELQRQVLTGRLGTDGRAATRKTVRHLRRKVKANRLRLRSKR